MDKEIVSLFKDKGAFLEGHFLLSSGLHSNQYWQSALLLQYPDVAEKCGKQLADLFPGEIDVVISPALGGLIIGQEVARAKGARAIFSEKNIATKPVLRRGFQIKPNENVLVIEDVITTGLSTNEVISLVQQESGNLIGVGSLVSRSQKGIDALKKWGKPVHSLLSVETLSWEANNCPLCKEGQPVVKPGSRAS